MTFFGSSANDACFNAWITDCADDTNRGAVEGINSMMPLLAIWAVSTLLRDASRVRRESPPT